MPISRDIIKKFGTGLLSVGLLLAIIALFVPWSVDTFDDEDERIEWGVLGGEVVEEDESAEWSWYDTYLDDDENIRLTDFDGVIMLRVALPLYVASAVVVGIGAWISGSRPFIGGTLGGGGALLGVTSGILVLIGIDAFETDIFAFGSFMEAGFGAFLGTGGFALALSGSLAVVGSRLEIGAPSDVGSSSGPPTDTTPAEEAPAPRPASSFRLDRRRH